MIQGVQLRLGGIDADVDVGADIDPATTVHLCADACRSVLSFEALGDKRFEQSLTQGVRS
jgi:hypothetical protein